MAEIMTRAGAAILCVTVLAAIHVGCEVSSDVSLPEEDRLLEDIMDAYVSERFRFYPVESTLSGLPGNDDRLGRYSRAALEERIAWLTDFHHKLMGLRLTALSQSGFLDAQWLTSMVKAELFELEERSVWRRSAAFYGDVVRLGLVSLLAEGELASRADALAARLGDVPRLLGEARENLEPAEAVWRARGLASLDACRRLLEDLPQMLDGRVPPHRLAELAGSSRAATRTVQELIRSLPELQAPGDEPLGYALGQEVLERYFFYEHLVDWSLDKTAIRAERELRRVTDALTELALNELSSQSLSQVVAPRPLTEPPETEVVAAQTRVLAFLRERDGAIPLATSIPIRRVPVYFPGTEAVRLWRPRALEPARGAFLMVREVPRADATELELLTLRELGGRARQYAHQAGSISLLRRVFAAPTTSEGLLAQFEQRVLDEGYSRDSHELRIAHYQRAMVDLARLLAIIGVHAHGQSLEDAIALFQERTLLSRAAARAEVERIAVELSGGDAGLGRLLVDDLAADYFRAHPLSTPSELEDVLLSHSLLPVRLLRFQIFE